MVVRCKMKVVEVIDRTSSYSITKQESHQVKLAAVTDPANKTWAAYTPSGSIELTINNPDAFAQFKVGETFFVDFTAAPASEAEEMPR